jgi:hypothetical protein
MPKATAVEADAYEVEEAPKSEQLAELTIYKATPGSTITSNVEELITQAEVFVQDHQAIEINSEDDYRYSKNTRSRINGVLKSLDAERKRLKDAYMAPYLEWESRVKVATGVLKQAADACKEQQDAWDEELKLNRRAYLEQSYYDMAPELADHVPLDLLEEPKWYQRSTKTEKHAEKLLVDKLKAVKHDLDTIETMTMTDTQRALAFNLYYSTLDLAQVMADVADMQRHDDIRANQEAERLAWLQEQREQAAKGQAQVSKEASAPTYRLVLTGITYDQATALAAVFKDMGIKGAFEREN